MTHNINYETRTQLDSLFCIYLHVFFKDKSRILSR